MITIGTATGSDNILNTAVGATNTFDIPFNLFGNTTYYVRIIPFNSAGDAGGCTETSFTTAIIATIPACATITAPLNNTNNVSINTTIDWNPVAGATGYRITVGTFSTTSDVLNNLDLGNVTSYTPPTTLLNNQVYYVT